MSWLDQGRATIRLGFVEHLADTPWPIVVTTLWPMAVAQCFFYTLLGQVIAGSAGGDFAYVGAVAMVITLNTIGGLGYLPGTEKWRGTFFRLQLSSRSPFAIFGLRSLPWIAQAAIAILLCLATVGPATGHADLSLAMIPLLPILLVMCFTCAAAGLAAASFALGRRAEVLVNNGLQYVLIAATGLLIPADRAPALDVIGSVLPLRHGVLAVRSALDGRPWLGEFGLEILVGAGWTVLAVLMYRRQARRARAHGTGDFA